MISRNQGLEKVECKCKCQTLKSGLSPHNKMSARVFFHEIKNLLNKKNLGDAYSKDFHTVVIIQALFWYLQLPGLRWYVVLYVLFPPYSFSISPESMGQAQQLAVTVTCFLLSCAAELNKQQGEKVRKVVQSQSLPQLKLEHGIILTPNLNAAGIACF